MSIEGHYPMQGVWGNNCSQAEPQHWQVNQHPGALSPPCAEAWVYPGASYPSTEMPRVPPMYHPGLAEPGYPHQHHQISGQDNFTWGKNLMDASDYMQQFGNHASTVARRNERERNRVRHINSTFENLRHHLPCSISKKKKLSKVDTLRTAIKYINHLQTILGSDMKPLTQDIKQEHGANKRQSLDSSVTSSSSVENNAHENELEEEDVEDSSSRGSPASSSATTHTPVPFMEETHFQWPSS